MIKSIQEALQYLKEIQLGDFVLAPSNVRARYSGQVGEVIEIIGNDKYGVRFPNNIGSYVFNGSDLKMRYKDQHYDRRA